MIICLCRGKSDRDIVKAIDRGAESLRDLQRCGIGSDCGSCHTALRHMLASGRQTPSSVVRPNESPVLHAE